MMNICHIPSGSRKNQKSLRYTSSVYLLDTPLSASLELFDFFLNARGTILETGSRLKFR